MPGQLEIALEHLETAIRLIISPRARVGTSLGQIGLAHFFCRRFRSGIAKAPHCEPGGPEPSANSSISRGLLRSVGAVGRGARRGQAITLAHSSRGAGPGLLSESRAPRTAAVGLALGGRRGEMSQTRRLAAILAADVAGYSRLIGADEAGALQTFKTDPRRGVRSEDRCASRPAGQDDG